MTERKRFKKDVTEKNYALCRNDGKPNEDKIYLIKYCEKEFFQNYDDALKNFYELVKLQFLLKYDKDVSKILKDADEGDCFELCEFDRKDEDMILASVASKTYFPTDITSLIIYKNGFVYSREMIEGLTTVSKKSLIQPVTKVVQYFMDDVIPKHIILANELKHKDCVQVSVGGESFWCEFLGFFKGQCVAKITNKLILEEYPEGNIIDFHFTKIMAVDGFDDKFSKVLKEDLIKNARNSRIIDYKDIYPRICSNVAKRQLDEIKAKNPPKEKAPSQPKEAKESKEERRLRIANEQKALKKARDNKSKEGQKREEKKKKYFRDELGILSPGQKPSKKPVITAGGASVSKDSKRKFNDVAECNDDDDDVAGSEENQSRKMKKMK